MKIEVYKKIHQVGSMRQIKFMKSIVVVIFLLILYNNIYDLQFKKKNKN